MMNNFNRFPSSSSSRPLFPAYDRNYLARAPYQPPFEQSHHRLNEFDLGRSLYRGHGPAQMPGSTRDFSPSYNRQRFQLPQEVHANYLSKDYNHGPETRLPLKFSETNARKGLEERETDNFSSYSSPNAFQSHSQNINRDNYLDDRACGMFESDFNQRNTSLQKLNVQNPLPTNQTKSIGLSSDFESDQNFMSRNFNNSLKEAKEVQNTEMPDESILMQVREIQNLQNLLKLSNDLSLIDEMSSSSSLHSPAVLDENSVGKNLGRNTSPVKQPKNFASVKDTFVKNNACDLEEDDLYSDSLQAPKKVLENRTTEMLSSVPKVSRQSEPVFSTSLLFETMSSSCPIKKYDDDGLYSEIDKETSNKDPYISDPGLYTDATKRFLSPKPQLPLSTFNAKLSEDADWSTSKTIPFLFETPNDKLDNRLKGEALFQDGIPSKSSSVQNPSKEIDKSDSCKSFLEDAIDVIVEKDAVVGLDYIIEYKNMVSKKGSLPFTCKLCNSSIGRLTVVSHVLGSKHRLNYLKAKDEETYRNIMSQKLKNKEKDEIISKAVIPLEKRFGRGRVIVQIKEIKEEEEVPIPKDSLIEVFEESSMTATSNEDAKFLTDDTNSSIKRSISENDKAVKILKVEKEEDIRREISDLDSKTVADDAQIKLDSSSEPSDEKPLKSAYFDDPNEMDVALESGNFDISSLLNTLADHSISSEEEADTISKVIGVLLKSLLHFKLQSIKNVNLEQLMASLSIGSEEALLKLLALLENCQQEARKINFDIDTKTETSKVVSPQNPCSSEEISDVAKEQNNEDKNNSENKDTVEMSSMSHVSETLPVLPSSDSVAMSQKVTSVDSSPTSTNSIPNSRGIPPHTVTSTPVSQVAPVTGLVPPPFFGWSNSPANTLANQSPSTIPNNFAWASPFPMMQMPGMPYYQQPASGYQQSMAAYSGFPQYGVPASQSNTATVSTGKYPSPKLPLIAQPPPPPPPPLPPPMTTSNQPPLPSSKSRSLLPLPPPSLAKSVRPPPPPSMPPLPPMYPPPPPLP